MLPCKFHKFFVDQSSSKCEPVCLHSNHSQRVPCCSIEYIAREFGSNTSDITIMLSGQINVIELILFNNITRLSIIGTLSEDQCYCVEAYYLDSSL